MARSIPSSTFLTAFLGVFHVFSGSPIDWKMTGFKTAAVAILRLERTLEAQDKSSLGIPELHPEEPGAGIDGYCERRDRLRNRAPRSFDCVGGFQRAG